VNLIDEAESLLLHQFTDSPKLIKLIRSLVTPLEEVATNIESLKEGRFIDQAHGRRLDILGHIVGQQRRGMSDEDYQAWIQVGIKLNSSSGSLEDILGILRILLGAKAQVLIYEYAPNDVVFTFFNRSKNSIRALFEITRSAVPIGTTCHFVCADLSETFRLDMSAFSQTKLSEFFKEDSL
jgi:hypothetical protein